MDNNLLKEITLKAGKEKSLLRRHPWIFSGAIESVSGNPSAGETVRVISAGGKTFGVGAYNLQSSIRIRMWDFDRGQEISQEWLLEKMRIAITLRRNLQIIDKNNISCRLIFSESDGLPGLIVDRYDDWLVIQLLTAGSEKWRDEIINNLKELTGLSNIYERSDGDARQLEGLDERCGLVSGKMQDSPLKILENGISYLVDIKNGHKTGFYLDQRENRFIVSEYAKNKRVLNCFAYTGGFTLPVLRGGTIQVTSIESSREAINLAKNNQELNGLQNESSHWICGDVFQELRKLRDQDEKYDLIILDPPKFAPTASFAQAAARGYKDINLLAFKLLNSGGLLVTFSCSGGITREFFKKIISDAALDAGAEVSIIKQLTQFQDHPINLAFPEGEYLKGFVCIKK